MAESDLYSEEKLLKKDFWAFIGASLGHWHRWVAYIGGMGIITLASWEGVVIPHWVVPWVAAFGFCVGAFLAWRDERRLKEKAERKLLVIENSYAYGLDLGAVDVSRATVSNANSNPEVYEIRYTIHILNLIDRPIRYQMKSISVDGQNVDLGTATRGAVIPAKTKAMYSFNGSFSTMVPENFAIPCRVRFHILYGHPDAQWTRELRAVLFGTSMFGSPIFEHMREQIQDMAFNRPSQ